MLRSEDNFLERVLSFHHVSPLDQTQALSPSEPFLWPRIMFVFTFYFRQLAADTLLIYDQKLLLKYNVFGDQPVLGFAMVVLTPHLPLCVFSLCNPSMRSSLCYSSVHQFCPSHTL